MSTTSEITRVTFRWDDRAGVESGWYAMSYDTGGERDDSQKIWFPVTVDIYARDETDMLEAALQEAFPGAEIVRQQGGE